MADQKLKVAIYWAASCGGCDVTITHMHEHVLDLAAVADIVFWPCAMDFKYADVEAMPDGFIDVCLFNGAIRTDEHEHIAKLLRRKTKVMVAYGSCAVSGGVPGLSNVTTAAEGLDRSYFSAPSTPNEERIQPQLSTQVPEGELRLPAFWDTVHSLRQVVDVEYFIPGCPPTGALTWAAIEAVVSGKLPPAGSTIAGAKSVCDECPLEKRNEMRISEIRRPWEFIPDPGQCLMEQGLICSGVATRSGCGAQCTKVLMPCRGCFGPMEGVTDHGAALLSAVASVIQADDEAGIKKIIDSVPDPMGTFYRFGLPESTLRRTRITKEDA